MILKQKESILKSISESLQYWLGNAKIQGVKAKLEMNNLMNDILQRACFIYPANNARYQQFTNERI